MIQQSNTHIFLKDNEFETEEEDRLIMQGIINGSVFTNIRNIIKRILVVAVSFALFTDLLVYGIIMPIIPDYVTSNFNASAAGVGFLVASYGIGLLVLTPVFGVLSDNPKVGRRAPMVLGLLGLSVSTIFFMFANNFYWLIFARLLQGASAASSWVIGLALIADVYPPEKVGSAMGIVMSANGLGMLVGPPIGGFMYEYAGYQSSFILCAALAVFDMVVRLLLVSDTNIAELRKQHAEKQSKEDQLEGQQDENQKDNNNGDKGNPVHMENKMEAKVENNETTESEQTYTDLDGATEHVSKTKRDITILQLIQDPVILFICGSVFLGSLGLSTLEPTLPLHLADAFNANSGSIGVVFGSIVVPYIISSSLVGFLTTKMNPRLLIAIGLPWVAAAVIAASFMPSLVWTGVLLGFGGFGLGFVVTPTLPDLAMVVQSRANNNANGQTYAVFNIIYAIGCVGGPLVSGVMYQHEGFSIEFIIIGSVLVAYPKNNSLTHVINFDFENICTGNHLHERQEMNKQKI